MTAGYLSDHSGEKSIIVSPDVKMARLKCNVKVGEAVCGLKLKTKTCYRRHVREYHRRHICQIGDCVRHYKGRREWLEHLSSKHLGITKYACLKCGRKYKLKCSYYRHMKKCQNTTKDEDHRRSAAVQVKPEVMVGATQTESAVKTAEKSTQTEEVINRPYTSKTLLQGKSQT